MPSKHPSEYTQAEVNVWLNSVGLGSKISVFQENAIDGVMLVTLSEADLTGDLGLSNLQARKFSQSLDFAKSLAEGGGGGCGADVISLQRENAKLREEVSNLKAINKELQDQLMPPAPAPAPQAYAPAPQAYAPAPAPQRHGAPVMTGAAGGALRGATLGAIGGAIAGDARQGAKMGAAMGGTAGGMNALAARRRQRLGGR